MSELAIFALLKATWETVYMVFIASFISIFLGLILGTFLFIAARKPKKPAFIYSSLEMVINIVRSIPFIILMISVIPLTHFLVGTTIGTNAAIIPLTIAAVPFFARICESALAEVPSGLIEAAHAMGASTWQLITKVLLA
ncbi:MAG: ABC transporter permease subunit, partial [Gammaproteobacteria bacterium]|nr:ABC transporter permease subunit [Gammaproteobacteria bacterium]